VPWPLQCAYAGEADPTTATPVIASIIAAAMLKTRGRMNVTSSLLVTRQSVEDATMKPSSGRDNAVLY
jgi:hypothetical protein